MATSLMNRQVELDRQVRLDRAFVKPALTLKACNDAAERFRGRGKARLIRAVFFVRLPEPSPRAFKEEQNGQRPPPVAIDPMRRSGAVVERHISPGFGRDFQRQNGRHLHRLYGWGW